MAQVPTHGFVWPKGLPNCIMCGRDANDKIHVTPARATQPVLAADKSQPNLPMRAHAFAMSVPSLAMRVTCQMCGEALHNGIHAVGLPSGQVPASSNSDLYGVMGGGALRATSKEQAFVTQIGHRVVLAAPVTTEFSADALPREVASDWQRASEQNPNNIWIAGRYVEADRPNRNAAYWSTEDLELGEPSVTHGPINWLHEERHIIGAIASSKMVHVEREAAASTGVGNHIVVLGAVWPYIYPQEAQLIQKASENGKLWASMECVSKEVACLSCDRTLAYRDYMKQEERCDHMRGGLPRRFKDPTFGGAGIIVPPVRPGWANADMRVLMPQAASIAEREAASFGDMPTTEAELLVAQIISHHTDGIDA